MDDRAVGSRLLFGQVSKQSVGIKVEKVMFLSVFVTKLTYLSYKIQLMNFIPENLKKLHTNY